MPFANHETLNLSGAKPGSGFVFSALLWAGIVLICCLALSIWLALYQKQRTEDETDKRFQQEVEMIAGAITGQLAASENLIRAFQSIFLASDEVTAEEYALAYENMRASSAAGISLQALAYAEADGTGHYITTRLQPIQGNEAIAGLDVAEQSENLEALLRARDSNDVVMSRPFHLRQSKAEDEAYNGLILRLPVYASGAVLHTVDERRSAFQGSIGASFRIKDLINTALALPPESLADLQIVDITETQPIPLFVKTYSDAKVAQVHEVNLQFAGRTWHVIAHMRQSYLVTGQWLLVLGFGVLISVLLAALVWALGSTHQRALTHAKLMGIRFHASEERFRLLNELLPCLVLLVRHDNGQIVYRNAAARTKLPVEDALARVSTELDQRRRQGVCAVGTGLELQLYDAERRLFWANAWITSIEIDGAPMCLLVANDISEQRHLTERLSYQASHDYLTKLFNRREFELRIQQLFTTSTQHDTALLFIDLDQFKLINDISGHEAGDALLVQLAIRIREELRPSDLLGRMGGDEFGVLLYGVSNETAVLQTAERLRRSIESFSFNWDNRIYTVTASIGAVMLNDLKTPKELFTLADSACYLAKEAGRNRTHFHSGEDGAVVRRLGEMEWANRIRDALRDGRLLLDYQEIHPLAPTDEGVHIELLLRLQDDDGNVVLPGAFLSAAERYGLMPMIDRWVIETALGNLDRLHPKGAKLTRCAINLSGASLEDDGLLQRIEHLLDMYRIDSKRILFEITETVAIRDFSVSSQLISGLRARGCHVALDDFGAGMSSFGYLKKLKIDVLKIDGGFVQSMLHDPMSFSIVKAVTEIGHQQGLDVVAEWVSSPELLEALSGLNVDFVQGFALHRPERVLFQRVSDE